MALPIIKLQNSKVILKNGKPSCECCDETPVLPPACVNPMPASTVGTVQITGSAAVAALDGLTIQASLAFPEITLTYPVSNFIERVITPFQASTGIFTNRFRDANCNYIAGSIQEFYGGAAIRQRLTLDGVVFQQTAIDVFLNFSASISLRQIGQQFFLGAQWTGGMGFVGSSRNLSTGGTGQLAGVASGTATLVSGSTVIDRDIKTNASNVTPTVGAGSFAVSMFVALISP